MLVTLEGIDGSGKTSVWRALGETYPEATRTHEPTDSWYGDAVRRSIDDESADSLAELFLYTADHAAHLAETVRPALEDGALVISDRYTDSRYAYQATSLADQFPDALAFVRQVHEPWTRPPDLTLYLDVDPATALDRASVEDKFERLAFLETVQTNYERLIAVEPSRFVRIDAEQPLESVTGAVEEAIADHVD